MIEKIKKFFDDNHLIKKNTRLLFIAVSGGVDSAVLLHLLIQLRKVLGVSLEVVHFNHKTRGEESDRDQVFVTDLANKYGLRIHVGERDGDKTKVSETELREARYGFFDQILRNHREALIATGHNRDDQIETFLMRLVKGSGLRGLLSIRPSRNRYIRPLLGVSRREISRYAEKNQLAFVQDKSNDDLSILRNKLRHQVIPYLEKHLMVDLDKNFDKVIKNLTFFSQIYQDRLTEAVISSVKISGNRITLNRKRYNSFNEVIKRGLIEYCISRCYPVNYIVSDRNFKIWDLFIRNAQSGSRHMCPGNGLALAEREQIVFGEGRPAREGRYPLLRGQEVVIDEKTKISWIKSRPEEVLIGRNRNIEYLDGDKCGDTLFVRFWRKGDRFTPLGMTNSRKLSDFFIDLKLSMALKNQVPLVCNQEQIVWIAGYRINENFKITDKTILFYRLELKNLQ